MENDSAASADPQEPCSRPDALTVLRERNLYRKLLDLGAQDELEPFLTDALSLIVGLSGALRGYIEIQDERAAESEPRFWIARGLTDVDVEDVRAALSRGVIAEAIATRKTVLTASALEDPRFRDRRSVRKNRIEAVLCAPIGVDPALGVLYLQGRVEQGPFTGEDVARAETFARHVTALADRLLIRRQRRDEADPTQPFRASLRLSSLVGRSAALARMLKDVALVSPRDVTVLLTGASGTGKTQLARIIHDNGPREGGPFVELNCAALPEALLESELFGALPGAHSTAARKIEGKIAAAEGGTLFLDEVGELAPGSQAKLLQLLQSKEYYPLGSPRPVTANIRLIAATNADLKAAVTRRAFREDLLYRLQVLPIRVPSLAERREDVSDLVTHLCARACEAQKLPHLRVSPGARRAAEEAEWPGNVRQLAHAMEASAIRAAGEGLLEIERRHVFPEPEDRDAEGRGAPEGPASRVLTFQEATRRFQREYLREALEKSNWNVSGTANRLDLTRAHVYNLIRAFGLERRR
jgi:Nif-specific regulatory protein